MLLHIVHTFFVSFISTEELGFRLADCVTFAKDDASQVCSYFILEKSKIEILPERRSRPLQKHWKLVISGLWYRLQWALNTLPAAAKWSIATKKFRNLCTGLLHLKFHSGVRRRCQRRCRRRHGKQDENRWFFYQQLTTPHAHKWQRDQISTLCDGQRLVFKMGVFEETADFFHFKPSKHPVSRTTGLRCT